MSIIDKARSDRRIAALSTRVQQQLKIKFKKSDERGWHSTVNGDAAVIEYTACRHPSAALARELLQLEMQLSGYRRIKLGISSVIENDVMPNFISVLDTELQRQKLIPKFIELGFQQEQFYRDFDKNTHAYLNHVLTGPPEKFADVVPLFVMLMSVADALAVDAYQEIYEKFLLLNKGTYAKQLLTIEQLLNDWGKTTSMDQTDTVKKIMLMIEPKANFSWFGFTDESGFPDQGFFVDEVFSVRLLPT
ncbi:hypothetical protein [Herminiimonas aquatilis]|uniref:Uncharacterized protein n=1 Tax=Herminiimonas aquatilis TaxID=345342 RepID=A0ABW2J7C8_9BURK